MLSRQFLIQRGYCCGHGCLMCPYEPKHTKGNTNLMSDSYGAAKELEKKIGNFISTSIEWVPLNAVEIPNERKEELINFFETLEEDDDVQSIYSNVKFKN